MKQFLTRLSNGEIIKADKLLHFSFEFLFTALFSVVIKAVGIESNFKLILFSFVVLLGFAKEVFDKYYKINGSWDWADIWYGIGGGMIFVLIYDYL